MSVGFDESRPIKSCEIKFDFCDCYGGCGNSSCPWILAVTLLAMTTRKASGFDLIGESKEVGALSPPSPESNKAPVPMTAMTHAKKSRVGSDLFDETPGYGCS